MPFSTLQGARGVMKPIEREGVTLKNSTKIAVVLAVTALGLLVSASSAFASHARPKSASPIVIKLVPAFEACTTGVATGLHGTPLALPSCTPPVERSAYLTAKAPERPAPFTAGTDGAGTIILKVTCTSGGIIENGDTPPCSGTAGPQQDVLITNLSAGVYCQNASQANCATAAAGSAYSGKVLGTSTIRITDHYNTITATNDPCETAATPGTGGAPPPQCQGTSLDLPFNVSSQCLTASCSYVTTANAVVAGTVKEFKRAVVELSQVTVQDAGADGDLISAPPPSTGVCPPACAQGADTTFDVAAAQGIFIP